MTGKFGLLFLLLPCAGCGEGFKRAPVHGEVSVDGQPLVEGTIDFFPTEQNPGPNASAVIENGKYDIPKAIGPRVGVHRVEIHGSRKTGRMIGNFLSPTGKSEEVVELLPADVNTESNLTREIVPGENVLDFPELKSIPTKRGRR